ncbi:MAG TPA: polysaccharide biosynthesis protein [Kofleriaceae bacterium]|nr:polysaccharide biosynthesis protein [Kofleriaceae bacterium]
MFDLAVLSVAYWLGFLFRFEFSIPAVWLPLALVGLPYVILIEYALLSALGVPHDSWRYISLRETARIAVATALATALLVGLHVGLPRTLMIARLPYGVLCMNFFLCFVGLVGVRATRRLHGEAQERKQRSAGRKRERVLLIGAGQAGVVVAREIASRRDLALQPVGFLDDDHLKIGTRIVGHPVLGRIDQVAEIAQRKRVTRVLITIANATGAQIRAITMRCSAAGLDTKIIPGIYEIVGDRVNLSRIREVAIEDLLGRDQVHLDEDQVSASIRGAVVMVTGAGGSIGSELCRQVCRYAPARLVLVEQFENALFEIHRELIALYPELTIDPQIGDVTDARRMAAVFAHARPSIVFHAAAHKHVPMMESNPGEAVKNNIGGTRLIAELADRAGVERFVLVSTDKAVNPTSVMGATKRVAEIYTQALALRSKTRFVTVRFGNVLGSSGSVIPIFKQQIAAGGPVTVTHPDMQRYFMTIPEASQLVLQAGAMGSGGEIFILDMGEPVKIVDLARDLITLSGFRPGIDIEIKFNGVRPGEKLFEQLATDAEHADKTKHPKIFIGRIASQGWAEVMSGLADLTALADSGDAVGIRAALRALVPEYTGGLAEASLAEPRSAPAAVPDLAALTGLGGLGSAVPDLTALTGLGSAVPDLTALAGLGSAVPEVVDVSRAPVADLPPVAASPPVVPVVTDAPEPAKPRRGDGGTGSQTAIAVQG